MTSQTHNKRKPAKQPAVIHLSITNQLCSPIQISQSPYNYKNIDNVCIGNNPNKNTIEKIIIKRFQSPNWKNMLFSNNSDTITGKTPYNSTGISPTSITIGTHTDSNSNIGQGLKPLNPLIVKNPFD